MMKKLPENIIRLLKSKTWDDVEVGITLAKQYTDAFSNWISENTNGITKILLNCSGPNRPYKVFRINDKYYFIVNNSINCWGYSKGELDRVFCGINYTEII